MDIESLSPRSTLVVGLLALVPLSWYALESSVGAGVVSAVNVLLVLACLFLAFSPVDGHGDHGSNGASS